jgi:hypothetical protein
MFRGFSGYSQGDAHAIYDALFRGDTVETATHLPSRSHVEAMLADVSGKRPSPAFTSNARALASAQALELDQVLNKLLTSARLQNSKAVKPCTLPWRVS